jgi:uncharacterized membrane protein
MILEPLLNAAPVIQFHVGVASLSLLLGPVAILPRRRRRLHKTVGYIWVLAMISTAISSFFIHSFSVLWGFSPIHLFAILTLYSLMMGIWHIKNGNIIAHRAHMVGLYAQGLLIAGLFNFLPGRVMNRMIFESLPEMGYGVMAIGAVALAIWFGKGGVRRTQLPT